MSNPLNGYNNAEDATDEHEVLKRHNVQTAQGLKVSNRGVAIPYRDRDGKLVAIQDWRLDGDEVAGALEGAYYSVGASSMKVLVDDPIEMLTIRLIEPDVQYICSGRADNIVEVAKRLIDEYPDDKFLVFCDNRDAAKAAADLLGCKYETRRYNPILVKDGLDAVRSKINNRPDMSWKEKFLVSADDMNAFADPEWLHENLVPRGQMTAIVAPPNGGKTSIMMWACGQFAKSVEVSYVNADTSSVDAKHWHNLAKEYGFELLLPDMSGGTIHDLSSKLDALSNSDLDLSGQVIVIDTLKKFTDVISKSRSKNFYNLCRRLTGNGMTIVLLGHTNKHMDNDGRYVYEGTGDLRADVDNLIYLYPEKNQDGSLTVSTDPDKTRAVFEPITFHIDESRSVHQTDYVDVREKSKLECLIAKYTKEVEAISAALQNGMINQGEIKRYCSEKCNIGLSRTASVLKLFAGELWAETRGQNNSINYSVLQAEGTPP